MVRPLRIEYEDAFYHVMNRGRGRQRVFPDTAYYKDYLRCLDESHKRFGIEIHAYCLMGNHYHLLIRKIIIDTHILFQRKQDPNHRTSNPYS